MQPAFGPAAVERYESILSEEAARVCARWRDGETIEVGRELSRLVIGSLIRSVFASPPDEVDLDALDRDIDAALEAFRLATSRPLDLLGMLRPRRALESLRAHESVRATTRTILARAREDGLAPLLARSGLPESEQAWEALVVLLAGVETTATALTWACESLARDPDAQAALRAGGRDYASAVLAETLRLYPPSWFIGRRALGDHELDGFELRAGTIVLVSPYLLHRDARWFSEPERFDPGRERPRGAYIPFGAGPRRCLGERIALAEGAIVLSTIAESWRLEPVDSEAPRPRAGTSLRPDRPVRLRVLRRKRHATA